MINRDFLRAGHPSTRFVAFFYFDISFMVWILLGSLGVQVDNGLYLDAAQKGSMVAVPILGVVNGALANGIGPKLTETIGKIIVLAGLLIFAILAHIAVVGLIGTKKRWHTTWGARPGFARI